jgi:hypothetical protein
MADVGLKKPAHTKNLACRVPKTTRQLRQNPPRIPLSALSKARRRGTTQSRGLAGVPIQLFLLAIFPNRCKFAIIFTNSHHKYQLPEGCSETNPET